MCILEDTKHVGYPIPTEMWNSMEQEEVDFVKHEAITRLLDIDLCCPYCDKVLIKADERKRQNT